MKFTPGPWKINPRSLIAAPIIETDKRQIAKALLHMGSEDNEVYYNARLIATAPELLEVLTELVNYFDPDEPLMNRAREVIAKVERRT